MIQLSLNEIEGLTEAELLYLIKFHRKAVEDLLLKEKEIKLKKKNLQAHYDKLFKDWVLNNSVDPQLVRLAYLELDMVCVELKAVSDLLDKNHEYRMKLSDELANRIDGRFLS